MEYDKLAEDSKIEKVIVGLKERGLDAVVVSNGNEALQKIKSLIPKGSSVMNGASKTLEQIGYIDYLKSGNHGWNNLHEIILAEKDKEKQTLLRKQSALSDFYLGSVHAVTEDGEMIIASNTGSQLPHIVFTSPNLIFVVGTQKISGTFADAMQRLEEYVYPLEDARMKSVGYGGSQISKILIFRKENKMMGRKVQVILVKEKLGF